MRISSERISDEYLEVNACGIEHITKADRGSNRPRGRSDYHALYVERGFCNLFIDGEWKKLSSGSFVLFRPHEPQRYFYLKSDNSRSHYIHFSGVGCEHLLKKLGIYEIRYFDIGKSSTYERISEEMVSEFSVRTPFYKDFCASHLYRLLSIVGRKYALRKSKIDVKSEKRISTACRMIYENIDNVPSVKTLAEVCCLSQSRFLHLFRETVGKSLTEFVSFIRIERAKELLTLTDTPICDIAKALGYEDQNYFSRRFRKSVGCSPSQHRKKRENIE